MLKKMLVLLVILGIASFASATMTLQINVNGQHGGITLAPSGTATLSIYSSGFAQGDNTFWGLITAPAYGTITGGAEVMPPAPDASSMLYDVELPGMFGGPGVFGYIDSWSGTATAPAGTYFDGITFHCEAQGDAVLQLIATPDFVTYTVVDTITIHQIPEPATMILLSLGGLVLRRFKK